MGYFEAELSKTWEDKIEDLPHDDFIEQGQIQLAREGKDFWIFGEDGEEDWLPGIPLEDFWEVYERWEDFHYFGLAHGRGTVAETRQTKMILKIGQKAWEAAESWKIKNAGNPDIDK